MDISNRFSLEDFLAYLFPGVVAGLGIYVLLLLTPLKAIQAIDPANIGTGILFLVISYILGVIFSGMSELVINLLKGHKNEIPFDHDTRLMVIKAFQDTFKVLPGTGPDWSRANFYLCRSMVVAQMPAVLPTIQRQSGLRQLRVNLLPSILIWAFAGYFWGIQYLPGNAVLRFWGTLIYIFVSVLIIAITIERARSNEKREVREVLTAFVAGYQAGTFREKGKK
jgi:hypothetical protein